MISFLQPLALLGLAAVAIPTLLHLMGRRLPPVVVFPAVRYLTDTEREHSRRLKLRNLLLLLLRTALILFLVLAAARPVSPVAAGRAHPPTAVAVVVDNSMSSGAVVEGRRMLDWARAAAREAVDRVEPGDRLWLVLADGAPRRLTRLAATRALDSVVPTPLRMDLAAAVRTAARTVADEGLERGEVVVFSDLQATAFSPGDSVSQPVLVWRPPDPPPNRWVDTAYADPPVWSPEGAVVAAVGGTPRAPTAIRLVVAERDLARAVASAGDQVVLSGGMTASGWTVAQVALDPDELRADDRRWVALFLRQPAAASADAGVGRFVREALEVLEQGGRIRRGREVRLGDTPDATIVFPPADAALAGAFNRRLAASGSSWRLGERVEGEWEIDGALAAARGIPVFRRHRLTGSGSVIARAGGEPWIVRDDRIVLVASRFELEWTGLPVTAAVIPVLDQLINRIAAEQSWILTATPQSAIPLPAGVRTMRSDAGPIAVPSDGRVTAPVTPGVYFLEGASGDTVGAVQVNHDVRESDLTRIEERELRASLGGHARVVSERGLERLLFRGSGRADLTGVFLAAAILAGLIEFGVASRGGARARSA